MTLKHSKAPAIRALTSLRFIAAITLVLYHYNVFIPYPPIIKEIMLRGIAGVSFFFILSGFVLTYNYKMFQNGLGQYRRYIQARLARIFPAQAVALLLITPVTLFFLEHRADIVGQLAADGVGAWGIAVSWIANLLLVNVYIPITAFQALWNEPAWSINDELFFYALFPLFLRYVIGKVSTIRRLGWLAIILSLAQIVTFVFAMVLFEAWGLLPRLDWYLVRSPLLRVWEFLIGCTLGAIFLKIRAGAKLPSGLRLLTNQAGRNTVLVGALLMILSITLFPVPESRLGLVLEGAKDYLLFTPVFATIILACAMGPTLLSVVLEHPLLVLLGEASYALYITHWIPVMIFRRVIVDGKSLAVGWYIFGILGSIIFSIGFYYAIELPLRNLLRPRSLPSHPLAELLGERQNQAIADTHPTR